jgi:hypothetical protein
MEGWVGILLGGLIGGGGIGAVLVFVATRKRDNRTDIADRFDDASQLAQYIRAEVERQVAPIKTEIHELTNAVRARETQLWLWDMRGRVDDMPMLPAPILHRLGLGQLFGLPIEDTQPINKEKH